MNDNLSSHATGDAAALTDEDLDAVSGGWGTLLALGIALAESAPKPSCPTIMTLHGGSPERDCAGPNATPTRPN